MHMKDVLLSIELSKINNTIIINQNIAGKYLLAPPRYQTKIDYLSAIKIQYQQQKNYLNLDFIHDLNNSSVNK